MIGGGTRLLGDACGLSRLAINSPPRPQPGLGGLLGCRPPPPVNLLVRWNFWSARSRTGRPARNSEEKTASRNPRSGPAHRQSPGRGVRSDAPARPLATPETSQPLHQLSSEGCLPRSCNSRQFRQCPEIAKENAQRSAARPRKRSAGGKRCSLESAPPGLAVAAAWRSLHACSRTVPWSRGSYA